MEAHKGSNPLEPSKPHPKPSSLSYYVPTLIPMAKQFWRERFDLRVLGMFLVLSGVALHSAALPLLGGAILLAGVLLIVATLFV